jgi:hypothetical protein
MALHQAYPGLQISVGDEMANRERVVAKITVHGYVWSVKH